MKVSISMRRSISVYVYSRQGVVPYGDACLTITESGPEPMLTRAQRDFLQSPSRTKFYIGKQLCGYRGEADVRHEHQVPG